MKSKIFIPKPSTNEVSTYLKLWDSLDNYTAQERSLRKLFTVTYPTNDDLDNILIKVCALNTFYSTNILSPYKVAVTIEMLMIDTKHRRSGIGTMLLKHLEKICDSDELWTSTNLSNTPMQRLLIKSGYEMAGFVNNLDPSDPELVFCKRLSRPN